MRDQDKERSFKFFGTPEIVELGIDDRGNRQWYISTREGWEETGEDGVLQLDMRHFAIGTQIVLTEPID